MERVEPQAGPNTVVLAGVELPIIGQVNVQDLARWASKITLGDYSFDSDQTTSTWIISSLTGGIGNEKLKEGVDDETYWTGTLETRYPGQITLPAYTHVIPSPTGGTTSARPLADFPSRDPMFYAAFNATVGRWDNVNRTFVALATALAAIPVNKAVEYNNLLYIPLGTAGYATIDTNGVVTNITSGSIDFLPVVAFCLWDNKLAALTTDGYTRFRYGAAAWEAAIQGLQIPSSAVPKNLVVFINQQQEPTIHVITNTDVWALDREHNLLYRTQLQFPPHPDHGKASANWRGESLYVSTGLGVHSYNGGIVASMGPDSRFGLPAGLRGVITSLEPEYNALIAVVEGAKIAGDYTQQYTVSPRQFEDVEHPFQSESALSSVMRWVQSGWHPVWESPTASGRPTWAHVSRADGNYRLWWGYGAEMHYQQLPYTFHNPKQGMRVGIDEFAPSGSLTTGWFDADMIAFKKLALHAEVLTEDVFSTGQPTGEVSVYFQRDDLPGWYHLGTTKQVGRAIFPFRVEEGEYGPFSKGQVFRRIRFRIDMASGDRRLSPVLNAFQLKFIKLPLSQLSFQFTVDLTQDRAFMGMGPGERSRFLRDLASSEEVYPLVHRDKVYRVRVTQTQGNETMGYDLRSGMTLNCLQVEVPQNELREFNP